MKDMERIALVNQIVIMRTLGADARNSYMRDQLREHVRMSVDALALYDRDTRLRRAAADRTRARVRMKQ